MKEESKTATSTATSNACNLPEKQPTDSTQEQTDTTSLSNQLNMNINADEPSEVLPEILSTQGLIYSERGNLTEIFCKPKILPIKSETVRRIEEVSKLSRGEQA